jgi:hypothetical protein
MTTAVKNKLVLPNTKTEVANNWVDQKILMLGPGGIGKSHFWSCGDKTLFLQCEAGLSHLSVMKVVIQSWDDFLEAGAALVEASKGEFPYDTIVIDTVDRWVNLANEQVINLGRQKFKNIEINSVGDLPNGQGWFMATNLVMTYLAKLEALPAATVLIGHHNLKTIKESTREYCKNTISIGGQTGTQLLHWSDHTLFIDGKMIGDTISRKVYTKPSQIREGKSRGGIVPDGWTWVEDMEENYKKLRGAFN